MISCGEAAWPVGERTYLERSAPVAGSVVEEGGRVEGRGL